ncbi:MAG: tRNA preQ1(34) S-adenosylmethionine ribosyltransferase-isomerase QueA [Oligoflexia bacterium]|nr:tRNA preQ1(34) S-adenosylmethionine ribosyltransferase-isomerase QueA [Oligoflexia bacterium]
MHELSDFDFDLPERLIAQRPAEPRDASRVLVLDRVKGTIEHRIFRDLPDYLDARDLLVANNTRVLKARLLGHRLREERGEWVPGGKVEFVLLEELAPRRWEGLFHASAKYNPGLRFEIPTADGRGLRGVLVRGVKDSPTGTVVAEFDRDPVESGAGEIPLPHYIERSPEALDETSYQTLYAKEPGSAAAPTAGLHFTPEVMARLRERGVEWREVTLRVGLGTFRPVKDPDISKHRMHEEAYEVPPETAEAVNQAKRAGKRIVAVGTTSVRTLESAWDGHGLRAGSGRTSIFIRPGAHEFRVVDRLLTNFHLPKSTLLMLVSAFAGHELVMKAYREAVAREYRFFSYGDAMLIV